MSPQVNVGAEDAGELFVLALALLAQEMLLEKVHAQVFVHAGTETSNVDVHSDGQARQEPVTSSIG